MWCKVVTARPPMKEKRSQGRSLKAAQRRSLKAKRKAAVRASITLPAALCETLVQIAQQKKVSLAWVVRAAAEKHVADKWTVRPPDSPSLKPVSMKIVGRRIFKRQ
jgi:hypothetical protein